MENTFKRELTYKKTNLTNGQVEYTFKSRRMAGHLRGMELAKLSLLWIGAFILAGWFAFSFFSVFNAFVAWGRRPPSFQ